MTENVKNKEFISPHLNKIKELQKKERIGLKTYAIFDHTTEGTKDIEDVDNWIKEITKRIK